MNAAAILKIVMWALQAITMIVDVVNEAIKKAEPPTTEKLKKTLHDIDEKYEEQFKSVTDEAEKKLREAAAAEFDSELADELSKKKG